MSLKWLPHYTWEIEYCPRIKPQLGQCVGICNVYAYLHVTGQVLAVQYVAGQPSPVIQNVDAKILPYKVIVPFMVIDDGCLTTDYKVRKCRDAYMGPTHGGEPEKWSDHTPPANPEMSFTRNGEPVRKLTDTDSCLEVKIDFKWLAGLITIGASGSAQGSAAAQGSVQVGPSTVVSGQVGAGASGGASGGVGVGGGAPEKEVTFLICYRDGCYTTPAPPGDVADGKQVWDAGKIVV